MFDAATTARFWAKVDMTGDCWMWTACVVRRYGQFGVSNGKRVRSHRYAYEQVVGPIPAGMQLDHLCRQPLCVRPEHLEPVTARQNTLRGIGPTSMNAQKARCIHGHELTGSNLVVKADGTRRCRTCAAAHTRAWRARRAVA